MKKYLTNEALFKHAAERLCLIEVTLRKDQQFKPDDPNQDLRILEIEIEIAIASIGSQLSPNRRKHFYTGIATRLIRGLSPYQSD